MPIPILRRNFVTFFQLENITAIDISDQIKELQQAENSLITEMNEAILFECMEGIVIFRWRLYHFYNRYMIDACSPCPDIGYTLSFQVDLGRQIIL